MFCFIIQVRSLIMELNGMKRDVQDTSLDAYYDIIMPVMGERQKIVYDTLKEMMSATDMEIAKKLGHSDPNKVRPRRHELMKYGYVEKNIKRVCNVTGVMVWAWKITK